MGRIPVAGRGRLWAAAALAVTGWAVVCGSRVVSGRVSATTELGVAALGTVTIFVGYLGFWRALTRCCYVVAETRARWWIPMGGSFVLFVYSAVDIGRALNPGSQPGYQRVLWLAVAVFFLFFAVLDFLAVVALIGDGGGLRFRWRRWVRFARVPWGDVGKVVVAEHADPRWTSLEVWLRPGATTPRPGLRVGEESIDLPYRLSVRREGFDPAGLRRLVDGVGGVELEFTEAEQR